MSIGKTMAFGVFSRSGISLSNSFQRGYAMKSPIPIKWNRPEKILSIDPVKSGDLKPLMEFDRSRIVPRSFRESEELKTADDSVKKLFTLEFFPRKHTIEHIRAEYLKQAKRHVLDRDSFEARIAKRTADIRDMQQYMEQRPMDKKKKVLLKEAIDKRKRELKLLRQVDYKCFEWLLEKMALVYKPYPDKDVYMRVERKRSVRMLTKEHCEKLVQERLQEYRASLEAEQIDFLGQKIETLKWIMKEESECNVPPTVTKNDIEKVEKQFNDLKLARKKDQVVNQDT